MVHAKCKKHGCMWEQEWEGRDLEYFKNWMNDYIKKHAHRMKCLHELEEVPT